MLVAEHERKLAAGSHLHNRETFMATSLCAVFAKLLVVVDVVMSKRLVGGLNRCLSEINTAEVK